MIPALPLSRACNGLVGILAVLGFALAATAQPPGSSGQRYGGESQSLEPPRREGRAAAPPQRGRWDRDDRDRDDWDRDDRDRDDWDRDDWDRDDWDRDDWDRDGREREEQDRDEQDGDQRDRATERSRSGAAQWGPSVLPSDGYRRAGRWVLGVYSQITSTGVRVRDVVPGSPAARAGLERDDVIVTVDGYQVGRVGRRTFPLGEELQNRGGRRGSVLLLVQNRRNDQLLNLPVQLELRGDFRYGPPRFRPYGGPPGQFDASPRGDDWRQADGQDAAEHLDAEGVE